jgi:hypothetical protein
MVSAHGFISVLPLVYWTPGTHQPDGWDLFDTDGTVSLQKDDDSGRFKDDIEVMNYVVEQAAKGDKLCLLALYLDGREAGVKCDIPKALRLSRN